MKPVLLLFLVAIAIASPMATNETALDRPGCNTTGSVSKQGHKRQLLYPWTTCAYVYKNHQSLAPETFRIHGKDWNMEELKSLKGHLMDTLKLFCGTEIEYYQLNDWSIPWLATGRWKEAPKTHGCLESAIYAAGGPLNTHCKLEWLPDVAPSQTAVVNATIAPSTVVIYSTVTEKPKPETKTVKVSLPPVTFTAPAPSVNSTEIVQTTSPVATSTESVPPVEPTEVVETPDPVDTESTDEQDESFVDDSEDDSSTITFCEPVTVTMTVYTPYPPYPPYPPATLAFR